MRAYSMDLRVRVLADLDDGLTAAEAADAHRVSSAWVRRLAQRRRETGEVAPGPADPVPPRRWPPNTTGCGSWCGPTPG